MKLSVNLFTTLDGVSQSPGSPDEDRRNGFEHGGWLWESWDDACAQAVVDWYEHCGALLLGRNTYDTFASHWPHVTDPHDAVAAHINHDQKHVVTSSPLQDVWSDSSTVLSEDFLEDIARLKNRDSELELQVHGSVHLARTLHEAGLVDIYRFLITPVVLGQGAGILNVDGPAHAMHVTRSTVTPSGVFAVEMTPREFGASQTVTVRDGKDIVVDA